MLKFYLTTVVIWMIIIYATAKFCGSTIKEKGWIKNVPSTKKSRLPNLFTLAAVPLLRLLVWIFLFVMCIYTREEFEEWINEKK
jgi:hypothetical protein